MSWSIPPFRDLGLDYGTAAHGILSALAYEMQLDPKLPRISHKHMRVGIDVSKAEQAGLARLLMDKGVFTVREYEEYMRLALNEELAREQDRLGQTLR
jgi:hypothetical protein